MRNNIECLVKVIYPAITHEQNRQALAEIERVCNEVLREIEEGEDDGLRVVDAG